MGRVRFGEAGDSPRPGTGAPTEVGPVVWSGLAYWTRLCSVGRGSAGLLAPPLPSLPRAASFCGWGKAGLTQSECRGWRRRLQARETGGEGVGSPRAGMGWRLGCGVAGRRACVTPASQGAARCHRHRPRGPASRKWLARPRGEAWCGDAQVPAWGPLGGCESFGPPNVNGRCRVRSEGERCLAEEG